MDYIASLSCGGRPHSVQSLEISALEHHGRKLDFVSEVSAAPAIGCPSSCDCLGCNRGSCDLLREKFLLSHLSKRWDTILAYPPPPPPLTSIHPSQMFLLLPWLPPHFPHVSHSQTITSNCWPKSICPPKHQISVVIHEAILL